MQSWVVLLLVGLCAGAAAGFFGVGGGFLLVPLLLFMGFEALRAVGTSFVVILMISISALWAHSQLHNVDYRPGIIIGLGGIIGAQVGARLLELVPALVFQRLFAVALCLIAVKMFFQR